jgi:hypothetical protein
MGKGVMGSLWCGQGTPTLGKCPFGKGDFCLIFYKICGNLQRFLGFLKQGLHHEKSV